MAPQYESERDGKVSEQNGLNGLQMVLSLIASGIKFHVSHPIAWGFMAKRKEQFGQKLETIRRV